MKLLIFLQNAWRRNAGPDDVVFFPQLPERSRAIWEKALWRSPSGKRLKEMLPDIEGLEISVTNASPRIGNKSFSKFPMDPDYVLAELQANQPDVVLLCGNEAVSAEDIVREWGVANGGVKVEGAQHPAYRLLSKKGTDAVRKRLEAACQS